MTYTLEFVPRSVEADSKLVAWVRLRYGIANHHIVVYHASREDATTPAGSPHPQITLPDGRRVRVYWVPPSGQAGGRFFIYAEAPPAFACEHPTAEGLPTVAYVDNPARAEGGLRPFPTNAPVIRLRRGYDGFEPHYTDTTADVLNQSEGVNEAQREAMLAGAFFGWDVPAANPAHWRDRNKGH